MFVYMIRIWTGYIKVTVIFVQIKINIVYKRALILSFLDYLLAKCPISNFWFFFQFIHRLNSISSYEFHLNRKRAVALNKLVICPFRSDSQKSKSLNIAFACLRLHLFIKCVSLLIFKLLYVILELPVGIIYNPIPPRIFTIIKSYVLFFNKFHVFLTIKCFLFCRVITNGHRSCRRKIFTYNYTESNYLEFLNNIWNDLHTS